MCEQEDKQREELVCPLLRLVSTPSGVPMKLQAVFRSDECLRERCAWWQPVLEQCAVLVAASSEEILKPKILRVTKAELERVREALFAQGLTLAQVEAAIKAFVES